MKTPIERYIEFAIDNGYECEHFFRIRKDGRFLYHKNEFGDVFKGENLIEAITSKEFIESIARGLWDGLKVHADGYRRHKAFEGMCWTLEGIEDFTELLTMEQALSIRDNTLEDFINNILN